MTDQDGNVYKTVTIGTQTWMAENLRTTKYNETVARSRDMYYLFGVVYKAGALKEMGFSVRCLMD